MLEVRRFARLIPWCSQGKCTVRYSVFHPRKPKEPFFFHRSLIVAHLSHFVFVRTFVCPHSGYTDDNIFLLYMFLINMVGVYSLSLSLSLSLSQGGAPTIQLWFTFAFLWLITRLRGVVRQKGGVCSLCSGMPRPCLDQ